VNPGFSFQFDSGQFAQVEAADSATLESEESDASVEALGDNSPKLRVLQAIDIPPIARPRAPLQQLSPRAAVPTSGSGTELLAPSVKECSVGCPTSTGTSSLDRPDLAELELLQSNVGAATSLPVEGDRLATTSSPVMATAAEMPADVGPEVGLRIDSEQGSLIEPGEGFQPVGALAPPGSIPVENADPSSAAEANGNLADAAPSPAPTEVAAQSEVFDGQRGDLIGRHLASIQERYPAAPERDIAKPQAQALPAAVEEPVLRENDVAQGVEQATSRGDAARLSVDHSNLSSAIIHDDELVAIKLGDLVTLMEDHVDRPLYVWMSSSNAASKFVTPETLAAAGITAEYDATRGQIVFSAVEN
jgi:hypothetical protein